MTVSRAGVKLADAVSAFRFDFRGKTVLDIGSSTGGFTEFALLSGASRVIAVEKGTRQMVAPLRDDPRVELHEKTDVFEFVPEAVPDVVVADVSFVSLRRVLSYAKSRLAGPETEFLVMLKPQFEASSAELTRGVVKNERVRREILREFERWLREKGFVVCGKSDNAVVGRHGNRERFYYLRLLR